MFPALSGFELKKMVKWFQNVKELGNNEFERPMRRSVLEKAFIERSSY